MNPELTRKMLVDARALVARLEEQLIEAELSDLPKEPFFDGSSPRFITFQKRFGKHSGRFYTYAAVGLSPNRWFITGRKPSDTVTGQSWNSLMDFMVSEETPVSRHHVIATYRVLVMA